jgi:hypothetical protein
LRLGAALPCRENGDRSRGQAGILCNSVAFIKKKEGQREHEQVALVPVAKT